MDFAKYKKTDLMEECKKRGIKGYSTKNKEELVALLSAAPVVNEVVLSPATTAKKVALSLFSGAGGDTCGLEAAGWHVSHFSEFSGPAIETHKAAFPSSELLVGEDGSHDVKKVPDATFVKLRGEVDLIFAGFPCFVAGTSVLTNTGYKPIETVTLADKLLTHKGKFQDIVNLQQKVVPTGTTLYELRIKYHPQTIVGTAEHPFYVRTLDAEGNLSNPTWKTLESLTINDFCASPSDEGHIWSPVESLTPVPVHVPTPVFNFEVVEDNSYVVENTVVHNCQGFSHAGKKRSDDPRNELVHEFVRAVRLIQPTWIVGENVKGLLSRKGSYPPKTPSRPIIDIIKELFEGIGYRITYKVVDATEVGVPQLRKRLLIVGHKGAEFPHLEWPTPPATPPTIRALLSSTLEGATELPALYKPADQPARFWIPTTAIAPPATPAPHPNLLRLVAGIRNLSSREKEAAGHDPKARIPFTEPEGLISFGVRKGGYHGQVLDPDAPSKTIICAYNQCPRLFVGLHNAATNKYWIRCLTPTECGQIQGFTAAYPWRGATKDKINQIGNAVPPPLATAIARRLETARFEKTPQVCDDRDAAAARDSEDEDDE